MQRNPEAVAAFRELGHEIACHGLRWKSYQLIDRGHRARAHGRGRADPDRSSPAAAPLGWYTGRDSPHTRELVVEHGGFVYDSDSYADDLPYWVRVRRHGDHLVVPYTLDTNDMRFASAAGFSNGDQFFAYLRDAFDVLYAEGGEGAPEDAVDRSALPAGRPSGARGGARAVPLTTSQSHDRVWIARRIEIAEHWRAVHPADP